MRTQGTLVARCRPRTMYCSRARSRWVWQSPFMYVAVRYGNTGVKSLLLAMQEYEAAFNLVDTDKKGAALPLSCLQLLHACCWGAAAWAIQAAGHACM